MTLTPAFENHYTSNKYYPCVFNIINYTILLKYIDIDT